MTYNTADDTYSKVYPAIEKYVNAFTALTLIWGLETAPFIHYSPFQSAPTPDCIKIISIFQVHSNPNPPSSSCMTRSDASSKGRCEKRTALGSLVEPGAVLFQRAMRCQVIHNAKRYLCGPFCVTPDVQRSRPVKVPTHVNKPQNTIAAD